jgi:hypothetical protein
LAHRMDDFGGQRHSRMAMHHSLSWRQSGSVAFRLEDSEEAVQPLPMLRKRLCPKGQR